MVTLFIMTLLAISIGGYLTYVQQQTLLGARSQSWNLALGLAEAGIEEGLQHLNQNHANLLTDDWSASGNTYYRYRSFTNGNMFLISIENANPNAPRVTCWAWATPPTFAQNAPPAFFATVGSDSYNQSRWVRRAVRVETSRGSLLLAAMVAKHQIDLKGNGILTDSFDSADSAKSTNGLYDPAKAGDKGDVASNDGIISTVSVQNANIYGHVYTGPGGTATVGDNGAVGSHAWQDAGNTGFQPGWVMDNANFTFPDTKLPYTAGTAPISGDVVTISSISTNSSTYTTSTYPTPPALGFLGPITTNSSTVSTSILPSPIPPGLITNTTYVTSTTKPSPVPPGLTTNFTTTSTSSKIYPAPGTYVGSVTTNIVTSGPKEGRGTWYIYNLITGITGYTYPVRTYQYVAYTYTYTVYLTTPIFVTNHYDNVIQNGDYYATSLSGKTIITGKARLVLANGLQMSGNDEITVAQGGSIKIYSAGTSVTVGGNGVMNESGFAGNFIVYCTPSVTSFTFNGNGEFTGVLVAPNADMTMNGGGNAVEDFIGCLMVNSVRMNGHFKFHYDEALGRMGGDGRFLITSWNEL